MINVISPSQLRWYLHRNYDWMLNYFANHSQQLVYHSLLTQLYDCCPRIYFRYTIRSIIIFFIVELDIGECTITATSSSIFLAAAGVVKQSYTHQSFMQALDNPNHSWGAFKPYILTIIEPI